jgi:hypothetical protein
MTLLCLQYVSSNKISITFQTSSTIVSEDQPIELTCCTEDSRVIIYGKNETDDEYTPIFFTDTILNTDDFIITNITSITLHKFPYIKQCSSIKLKKIKLYHYTQYKCIGVQYDNNSIDMTSIESYLDLTIFSKPICNESFTYNNTLNININCNYLTTYNGDIKYMFIFKQNDKYIKGFTIYSETITNDTIFKRVNMTADISINESLVNMPLNYIINILKYNYDKRAFDHTLFKFGTIVPEAMTTPLSYTIEKQYEIVNILFLIIYSLTFSVVLLLVMLVIFKKTNNKLYTELKNRMCCCKKIS